MSSSGGGGGGAGGGGGGNTGGGGGGVVVENFRDRDQMYKFIISQLYYDGHGTLAKNLSMIANIIDMCPPSNKLYGIVQQSLRAEGELASQKRKPNPLYGGIDLDYETERSITSSSVGVPSKYETVYVTSHKGPCRAGAFSPDGQLVATGSVDASIKVLDVERMIAKSAILDSGDGRMHGPLDRNRDMDDAHPVIRTLYDHVEEVSALAFHPKEQFLMSGSHDMTLKLFDYSKPSVKRATKSVVENNAIRCLAFHPSGDYVLVGTEHPMIRLYHLPTFQSFVSANDRDHHTAPITAVTYSHSSSCYASCSKDGDIRLWDTVSNRCVAYFPRAHDSLPVCSIEFSRNGKYLLSSGKDSMVKLWELSMSRCLIAYTGAGEPNVRQMHRAQACFNHTEDYVMLPDEKSTSLCCWDSRNAERQPLLALGHQQPVRHFCHSPNSPTFLTCSDDYRARFWYYRNEFTD